MIYREVEIISTGWGPFHTFGTVRHNYTSSAYLNFSSHSTFSSVPGHSPPTKYGLVVNCTLPNGTFLEEKITEEELHNILADKLKKKIDKYLDNSDKLNIFGQLGSGPETVKDILDNSK